MELSEQHKECYACYALGIMPDCRFYEDLVELELIKRGDRCLTLATIDDDVDKALRRNPCQTYTTIASKILENPPEKD